MQLKTLTRLWISAKFELCNLKTENSLFRLELRSQKQSCGPGPPYWAGSYSGKKPATTLLVQHQLVPANHHQLEHEEGEDPSNYSSTTGRSLQVPKALPRCQPKPTRSIIKIALETGSPYSKCTWIETSSEIISSRQSIKPSLMVSWEGMLRPISFGLDLWLVLTLLADKRPVWRKRRTT